MCAHTFKFFNNASHKRERVSYECVYKFKVMPNHQKFFTYAFDTIINFQSHAIGKARIPFMSDRVTHVTIPDVLACSSLTITAIPSS